MAVCTDFFTNPNHNGWQVKGSKKISSEFFSYDRGQSPYNLIIYYSTTIGADPCVAFNSTQNRINHSNGTLFWMPNEVSFYPGAHCEYSHMIWTCSTAGNYIVTVTFTKNDIGTPIVFILKNNNELWNCNALEIAGKRQNVTSYKTFSRSWRYCRLCSSCWQKWV